MRARRLLSAWLALQALACGAPRPTECHFGEERTLLTTTSGHFSGLALVVLDDETVAVLSSGEGLRAVRTERGEHARLGPECDGGFAAVADDRLHIACVLRGDDARGEPGRLLLSTFDASLRPIARQELARVAPGGGDVALAPTEAGVVIVFTDGRGPHARAYAIREDSDEPPRLLSNPRARASGPSVLARPGGFVVAWAETVSVASETAGRVWIANENLLPRPAAEVAFLAPAPHLARLPDGLALGFRDHRAPFRREGFYVLRLGDDLHAVSQPARVGRANAQGAASLVTEGESVYAIMPHRWDKHEVLVGARPLDGDLHPRAQEQQDYEWAARIERARGQLRGGTLTLLTAERSQLGDAPARARTITLRCE